jgi:uncharacterized protein YecA (UPF0149 family)
MTELLKPVIEDFTTYRRIPRMNKIVEQPVDEESFKPEKIYQGTPRNAPCPCGSGKKFKKCHGG